MKRAAPESPPVHPAAITRTVTLVLAGTGVALDPAGNVSCASGAVVSHARPAVATLVVQAREDGAIAQECFRVPIGAP